MVDAVDPFTAIEDAACTAITEATVGKVKKVESIAPNWTKDMLIQVLGLAPAIFVAVTGGINKEPGAELASLMPSVSVMVAVKNVKEQNARRGSGTSVGAYALIFAVIPGLHGLQVPGVGVLQFKSVDPVDVGEWEMDGATLYELAFEVTEFSVQKPVDLASLNKFETFNADWKKSGAAGDTDPTIANDIVTIEQDET